MPFSSSKAEGSLQVYRVVSLLAAALIPAFGYLYHWRDPAVIDPLSVRWVMGGLPLALVVASYVSAWARGRLEALAAAVIYVLVTWFGILTALNGLSPDYALGYLFVVVMTGVATPETSALRTTLGIAAYTVVVAVAVVAAVGAPGTDVWIFLVAIACTAVSICLGLWLRHRMRAEMEASEVRYRTVFDHATDGLFLSDAETHRFLHANQAYLDLTGYTLDELCALTLHDVVVAPPGFIEERARALPALGHVTIGEQQHRRNDGTPVDLSIGVSVVEQDGRTVFCTTAHDLTEQKHVRAETEAARARAEEMLRLKTALLQNVSHELRTPLVGILGFAEILADEVPDEQREMVDALNHNARRLSATLHALLDLAHLKSGEAHFATEVVDLGEEAEAVAAPFAAEAEAKGLAFRFEAAPAARAQLDRDALRRILTHLLSNAVKFTAEGEVALTVEATASRVAVRVRDTGIGIDEAAVPALFTEFEQGSMGMRRSHEGSGLGLAITRQLVDLMEGHIEVETAAGLGTTFTVSFERTWGSPAERLESVPPVSLPSLPTPSVG